MPPTSPRQFSIRTLLILTAVVAVDLAWLRNCSDDGGIVGIVFGLHALTIGLVWLCYRISSKIVIKTGLNRFILGWLSTTLAGACFASLYVGTLDMKRLSLPLEEVAGVIGEFIALLIVGGLVAGLIGFFAAAICDIVAHFVPHQFMGRTQATLTGVVTAATTTSLLLSWDFVQGIEFVLSLAVPIGFAIAICYPFGRLWDYAPAPRKLFPSNIQELDMHWAEAPSQIGNSHEMSADAGTPCSEATRLRPEGLI